MGRISGIAAVVVLAAVVGSGCSGTSAGTRRPPPTRSPAGQAVPAHRWPVSGWVQWVAVGADGHAYAVVTRPRFTHPRLLELSRSGRLLGTTPLPAPADFVTAHGSTAWVSGACCPTGLVTALSIGSGRLHSYLPSAAVGVGWMAADDSGAWLVETGKTDRVVHLVDTRRGVVVAGSVAVPGARSVSVAADGNIWVQALAHRVVELAPESTGGARVVASLHWAGNVPDQMVNGGDLWSEPAPARLARFDTTAIAAGRSPVAADAPRLRLPNRAGQVVGTDDGSVFATYVGGVAYFSPAVAAAGGEPTALLETHAIDLVPAPSGGVLIVTGRGRLLHWNPTG